MRRARLLLLIVLGLVVFVAVSAVLARVLSVDGAERAAVTNLIQAEARGDAGAMIIQIQGCAQDPGCRQRVQQDASNLRRAGSLKILELNTSAGISFSSTIGTARVAWRAGATLPIVQCVLVRRAGNAVSGLHIELLKISVRIKTSGDCPAKY